jgi:CDP-diacylglycerol--glycerol-3-phosphate 3-phosphatidyltransferase
MYSNNQILLLSISFWVAISDFLDGYLARKWNVTSEFGRFFDQIADKIIIGVIFTLFFYQNKFGFFFYCSLLFREILVVILRYFKLMPNNSNFLGKAKTFFIYFLIIVVSFGFKHELEKIKLTLLIIVTITSWLSLLIDIRGVNKKLIYFFGTSCFTSIIIKNFSGTISSLFVFIIIFFLKDIFGIEYRIGIFISLLLLHFACFNLFLSNNKLNNDDPGIYTLDETIAIFFSWVILGEFVASNFIILFILFRFFDIAKPLGIKNIEKNYFLPSWVRNIADDLVAMAYSLIIFLFIEFYV